MRLTPEICELIDYYTERVMKVLGVTDENLKEIEMAKKVHPLD